MNEKKLITVLEALASVIDDLTITIDVLKFKNEQLEKELNLYKTPTTNEKEI